MFDTTSSCVRCGFIEVGRTRCQVKDHGGSEVFYLSPATKTWWVMPMEWLGSVDWNDETMVCYSCGEEVVPEDDCIGCGCHCPECNTTL